MRNGGPAQHARRRLTLTVLALLVSASAACASPAGDEPEQRVLRVLMADDWANVDPVVDAVRAFESEHPGVRVQVDGMPFSQIIDAVRAGVEVGDLHDVAHFHAFAAAAQDLAEPLDDLWTEHLNDDEYLDGAVAGITWGDTRYGVPLDTNAMVLMANADAFTVQGIELDEPPATFADLEALARAVTTPSRSRRGIALPHSNWTTYGWIRANGGEVVEIAADGTPTFTLDHPRVVEALDFLGRLVREDLAFPPPAQDVSLDAFDLYRTQDVFLHASGTWDIAGLEDAGVPWRQKVMLLPGGITGEHQGSALGGSSLFVPRGSEQRELAFEFMLHLTSDQNALRLAAEEGRLPARPRVFDDPVFDTPELQVALRQLRTADPMMLIAFPEADVAFSDAIGEVLVGNADAHTALTRAQRRAERSLETPGP